MNDVKGIVRRQIIVHRLRLAPIGCPVVIVDFIRNGIDGIVQPNVIRRRVEYRLWAKLWLLANRFRMAIVDVFVKIFFQFDHVANQTLDSLVNFAQFVNFHGEWHIGMMLYVVFSNALFCLFFSAHTTNKPTVLDSLEDRPFIQWISQNSTFHRWWLQRIDLWRTSTISSVQCWVVVFRILAWHRHTYLIQIWIGIFWYKLYLDMSCYTMTIREFEWVWKIKCANWFAN